MSRDRSRVLVSVWFRGQQFRVSHCSKPTRKKRAQAMATERDIDKHNIEVLRTSLGTANMRLRALGGDPARVRYRDGVWFKLERGVERGEEKQDDEPQALPDHDATVAMEEDGEHEDEQWSVEELLGQYPPHVDVVHGVKVWDRVVGFEYKAAPAHANLFAFWEHLQAWVPRFRLLPVLWLQLRDELDVIAKVRGKRFDEALADLHALRNSHAAVALQLAQFVSSRAGGGPGQLWCVAPHSHSVLFAWDCRCRRGVSPYPDAD